MTQHLHCDSTYLAPARADITTSVKKCRQWKRMESFSANKNKLGKSWLKCIKFNVVQNFPCEAGSRREKVMVTLFMFTQTHSDKILPLRPYLSVCTSNCLEKRKVGLKFRRVCVIYRNIWTNNTIFLTIPFIYPPFARILIIVKLWCCSR